MWLWQIKELEEKLREQEQKLQNRRVSNAVDGIRASPTGKKTCAKDDERMTDVEANILKCSNSINRPSDVKGYSTAKAAGDEARKKRHSRNGETENCNTQACFNDYRGRKSDPPKIARVTSQATLTHKRINRETTRLAIKDRDPKKRTWC